MLNSELIVTARVLLADCIYTVYRFNAGCERSLR